MLIANNAKFATLTLTDENGDVATTHNWAKIASTPGMTQYEDVDSSTLGRHNTVTYTYARARPQKGTPNGYTQGRNKVVAVFPQLLANGQVTTGSVRIEASFDVEQSRENRRAAILSTLQLYLQKFDELTDLIMVD